MIINAETIRRYRPIAKNIQDEHIAVYIEEAEKIDILPAIGADLYRKFINLGSVAVRPKEAQPAGDLTVPVAADAEQKPTASAQVFTGSEGELPQDEWLLLNGGYYDASGCGREDTYFAGIKAALAYFAYARFLRNHSLNATPFGIVVKEGDGSSPASSAAINAAAASAEKVGREYLAGSMAFWKTVHKEAPKRPGPRKRFLAIGD